MNKLLTAAAVIATLGVALPAAAQSFNGGYNGNGYGQAYGGGYGQAYGGHGQAYGQTYGSNSSFGPGGAWRGDRSIEARIAAGERNGSLTRSEARALTWQLEDLRRLEWQYSRNGVSAGEARELDRRYATLTTRLRMESRDRDTRWGDNRRDDFNGRDFGRNGFGYR